MLRVKAFQGRRAVFDGTATHVVFSTEEGELSVLDFHAPMLCALTPGQVRIDETVMAVRRGVVRVGRNLVTIVAD